eukprot:CAMPEP_0172361028 /NCGR_PEP_ID=MMETSP1060-20121228/4930_1 /TAXON_ID=37318 /ORGANISM="Pseudo-nitzschia pungens, Strain cf. cingulata" /LENGTH=687 /DNA_ID=CAMNT_0013083165 /DNA_START=219 /DNA_END=2282 /DNA_ORIENTATION=-
MPRGIVFDSSQQTQIPVPRYVVPEGDPSATTLALSYPTGLYGGYRNQVMRFTGFLKHAQSAEADQLLLPTLVLATRYHQTLSKEHHRGVNSLQDPSRMNPARLFWPVPFEEMFDVEHWNSLHHRSKLPLLVNSLRRTEDNGQNNGQNKTTDVCWNPHNNETIISRASIRNNPRYNTTFHDTHLPLLTQRMLFDTPDNNNNNNNPSDDDDDDGTKRPSFLLDVLQSQAVEFLVGKSMQRFHRINFAAETQHCKHPIVVANMQQLWNAFYSLKLRSPEVVGSTAPLVGNDGDGGDDDDEEEKAQRRHRRLQEAENNGGGDGDNAPEAKKNTDDKPEAEKNNDGGGDNAPESKTETTTKNDPVRLSDTLLQKSMFEALVPAQPWRRLADKCTTLQMEAAAAASAELSDRLSSSSSSRSRGRYIALHPRIEPEMMLHRCSRDMEKNFTRILENVDRFVDEYNRANLMNSNNNNNNNKTDSSSSGSSSSSSARHKRNGPLRGMFVAVSRKELVTEWGRGTEELAKENYGLLNERSTSYDKNGTQLFSSMLASPGPQTATANAFSSPSIPLFECGEDWVEHAFYNNKTFQAELFSLPKAGVFYERYVAQSKDSAGQSFLPLPNNYYGDLLPAVMNFWLAVKADIFVGVMRSTWSNDVWTERYYKGKGDGNYEHIKDRGVVKIGNGGLPQVHNC